MRITFILPSYPRKPVGGYRIIYQYANHLAERGHQVNLVHPRKIKGLSPLQGSYKFLNCLVYFYRIFIKPKPNWQLIDSRIRLLYIPEPLAKYIPEADAVFATSWAMAEYVYQYPENKGEKCYLFQHYETWSGPKEKVDASWRSSLHKIVISKWLYNVGLSLGAKDMFYIPNGIDHNHFKLLNPIEKRRPCVSMMYSEISWKGVKDGILALSLVKKEFSNLRTIFFGVGKRADEIPGWIEYWEDPLQEALVKDIYNQSSIFLCPSHTEGFALPPAEAMACGCALVTTDCGGVKDFAENEVTALISPAKNPQALAQNLSRFLKDDDLRIEIAKAGYDRLQQFNWERSADLLEKFLEKICQKN